jgi:hypothetical protein
MASNTRAIFNIAASYQYKASSGNANAPGTLGPQAVNVPVTGGTGSSKGYDGGGTLTIAAAGAYTLDLAAFVDSLNLPVSWTSLTYLMIEHASTSLAVLGIDLNGAAVDAMPGLRGSSMLPGQGCVPFYNQVTSGSTVAGRSVTGPNSRIVIQNLDPANAATVNILVMGN